MLNIILSADGTVMNIEINHLKLHVIGPTLVRSQSRPTHTQLASFEELITFIATS